MSEEELVGSATRPRPTRYLTCYGYYDRNELPNGQIVFLA